MTSKYTANWELKSLTELVKFPSGQVDPRKPPYNHQILLAPDHIESHTGRILKQETAQDQGATSGKYAVKPGDVVLSKIRPTLRKAAIAEFNGTCSADMYPLRPVDGVSGRFILEVLLSEEFSRYAEGLSGRTGIPKVNRRDLSGYLLKVPQPEEQRQISEVLCSITDAERSIEDEIKKSRIVQQAVVDNHAFSTEGRNTAKVGDYLLSIEAGESPDLPNHSAPPGGWGILKVSAIHPSGFRPSENKSITSPAQINRQVEVHPGDLLVSRANTPELVGTACIATSSIAHLMLSDKTLRLTEDPEKADRGYIALMLASNYVRRQIGLLCSGSSRSMQNISQESIEKILIHWPTLEEQRKFSHQISMIHEKIRLQTVELTKLRKLKRGLADDLLSGRVSVRAIA
ncbi:hypothetical protein SUDANB106_03502 [Streptomyces sp. enrichment culture]|uniref:restriction endonuclease subunit S n=1 Tax=Streptomyces sp. enrichment culture TaxID=1795815 RepID=UPI003F553D41